MLSTGRADWFSARHGEEAIENTKTAMAERAEVERLTEFPSMVQVEVSLAKGPAGR
jgi:hypothetical protein